MNIERVTVAAPGGVSEASAALLALGLLGGEAAADSVRRDGERWVQVDVPGTGVRLAVSGPGGGIKGPTLMLKVADLDQARTALAAAGVAVGEVSQGAHELTCEIVIPTLAGLRVVLYRPA